MKQMLLGAVLILSACRGTRAETAAPSQPPGNPGLPTSGQADIRLGIGGVGGVYFLAGPGELWVDLEKRNRNRQGGTELRAILLGPDRRILQEVILPDDGRPKGSGVGPPQRTRLATRVDRKGVYALNITVSGDRYGDDIIWGFRTNCPRYLIETSRGHRDERRQEPIVLLKPDLPGDVCFVPRKRAFGLEVSGLPKDVKTLPVFAADGTLIETLQADAKGQASCNFAAGVHRDAVPWRLHLDRQQATIQIDGTTRWDTKDIYPNLPYWTPEAASYFPFQTYRWLLTPYSRNVYGQPGSSGTTEFRVKNNSDRPQTVQLGIGLSGEPWPAELRLSADKVVVKPGAVARVSIQYTVPAEGQTRVCHLRATPAECPDFTTYSTLTVIAGTSPATRPLNMPLVLKPYRHENERFGYLPDYPTESEFYFDLKNRPFTQADEALHTWRDGQWTASSLGTATPPAPRSSRRPAARTHSAGSKIAFDRDNDLYIPATVEAHSALLHSNDGGRTFTTFDLGKGGALDIEQFSGHNVPDGPPPVLRSIRTASDPKRIWRRICDLELLLPTKVDGRLTVGDPILISRQSLGVGSHSGHPSAVVSRGSKVHVVWAEATDPDISVPGVPTYVASYDRQTNTLGKPVLVGYGAPPNDVHNRPCITMDSQGYLHVLTGTHGRPFYYARSLKPSDAHSGWTQAEPVGDGLRQTYIGMVCGPDDTLHLVFRLWRSDPAYFSGGSYGATLAYQRKKPGQPWESPRILIVSAFSEYSVYYHRLTVDRSGRLFLSYDYWSTYWFYRTDHMGDRRAVMMSADGGQGWKLVQTQDLLQGAFMTP